MMDVVRRDEAKQQRFIVWLCTPKRERVPSEQAELAKVLNVPATRLTKWKQDPEFVKQWEAHYMTTIASPERKQSLLDTLLKTGNDADDPRHVAAAKTYMDIVQGLKPQQVEVTIKRPIEDLSDEELDAIVARQAGAEASRRQHAQGDGVISGPW